jgi:hypothetical protein
MAASSTWESFSTFLDQQQQPNQSTPGQLPDWSENFRLGERPNYNSNINVGEGLFPGIPTEPPQPGIPSTFNPNQPTPYQQPNNNQYGVQQLGGVTEPSRGMDPAGSLFASFGQGERHAERRERNRGGAYGSAKRDKQGTWMFN